MKAEEIRKLREGMKLSRREFAELVGVSHRTIEKWEYGTRNPRNIAIKTLKQIGIKNK